MSISCLRQNITRNPQLVSSCVGFLFLSLRCERNEVTALNDSTRSSRGAFYRLGPSCAAAECASETRILPRARTKLNAPFSLAPAAAVVVALLASVYVCAVVCVCLLSRSHSHSHAELACAEGNKMT